MTLMGTVKTGAAAATSLVAAEKLGEFAFKHAERFNLPRSISANMERVVLPTTFVLAGSFLRKKRGITRALGTGMAVNGILHLAAGIGQLYLGGQAFSFGRYRR